MEKFTAQAGWSENGQELDDTQDFDTQEAALAWLDDYHAGREMREIWQGRRLVCQCSGKDQDDHGLLERFLPTTDLRTAEDSKEEITEKDQAMHDAEVLANLEADAEFFSAATPECGCEWGCWRCEERDIGKFE